MSARVRQPQQLRKSAHGCLRMILYRDHTRITNIPDYDVCSSRLALSGDEKWNVADRSFRFPAGSPAPRVRLANRTFLPDHMESDTGQPPIAASSTVRNFLSIVCLGWYAVHWFIQLVGVFTASVDSPSVF